MSDLADIESRVAEQLSPAERAWIVPLLGTLHSLGGEGKPKDVEQAVKDAYQNLPTTGSSQIAPGAARPCHTRQPGPRTPRGTTRPPGIASSQMSRSPQNPGSFENEPTRHGPACCEGPCMSTPFPVPDAPHPWPYSPF